MNCFFRCTLNQDEAVERGRLKPKCGLIATLQDRLNKKNCKEVAGVEGYYCFRHKQY